MNYYLSKVDVAARKLNAMAFEMLLHLEPPLHLETSSISKGDVPASKLTRISVELITSDRPLKATREGTE